MWNPPIALTLEEQKRAARTQKTRQCFVFLRTLRHALLDAALQQTLAQRDSPAPGGQAPVEAGMLALAPLLPAYGTGSDRDAGERTVMDTRWQRVWDCLGAEPPPCRHGTLFHLRLRRMAHHLDKTLRDRPVALAEQTGGGGARHLRAALDSTPLFGAGRVEDPCNRLGHALRKAVGHAARELGRSTAALLEDAGLGLGGHSSLKAALDLAWGAPRARERALGLGLAAVDRWKRWLAQHPHLLAHEPPLKEGMDTLVQSVEPATEPDPAGGPGGRRLTPHVAPDRRLALADQALRHGRKSRSKPCHGFQEHFVLEVDRTVTREGVVCPANASEHAAVEWVAAALESGQGLVPRDIDLGSRARPRMAQWADQGVHSMARPWPHGGALCTKHDCTLDCVHKTVTGPTGQTGPMVPGREAQFPAGACDRCAVRPQCTTARLGQGRSLTLREEESFQQQRRATSKTKRGRASLRKRTAGEHALSHHWAHQGRRARDKGLRKNQCNGRRHAAVRNVQVAARYAEARQLAS